mgnify:FL=1
MEGVWVFGMVEAIRTNETRIRQYYSDGIATREEEVSVFKAGKRFVCTVTNRSALTLLPIIYKYVVPGSVIRSDGWAGYRGLHPREWIDRETRELRVAAPTDQHIYIHQVVNHSVNFSTTDHVRQNNTSGEINTNIVEGMWRDMKDLVSPRYRTKRQCPKKLLEYLWRWYNHGNQWEALERCLKTVSFPLANTEREGSINQRLITDEGMDEGEEEQIGEYNQEESVNGIVNTVMRNARYLQMNYNI